MITTTVVGKVKTSSGDVVEGAEIAAKLNTFDYDPDFGYITNKRISTTTDINGEFSFDLWPNTRGTDGTFYRVVINSPVQGVSTTFTATIPEQAEVDLNDASELGPQDPLDPSFIIVADNITDVNTAADNIGDVSAVATNITDVNTVAGLETEMNAVVADEVKQLANDTSENTEKIAEQIRNIQEQTSQTVDIIDETQEKIEIGVEEVEKTLSELNQIEDKVTEVSTGIHEVATANNEQADTVEELTATLENAQQRSEKVRNSMDEICKQANTQQNAVEALADEVQILE